ncbi:hypothetical protein E3P81_03921 [Wallemia ichthyophaga]|nr:hypothetical protein E3P97_03922 [Wallemia ichthyophaga]TIB28057.1 hypothetical protein E3P85_03888 [Wallemia ichthyophaga]TIB43647.1 hypothetical protein E3P82_03927 [Wallemia ichthyophaga]TIB45807.1 hypothetical protein E3P81_03921 [Wallemia ichthyophaga]TIB47929.1 hypothetical protein E3P80_03931 [Wallemia ichthyophaga]
MSSSPEPELIYDSGSDGYNQLDNDNDNDNDNEHLNLGSGGLLPGDVDLQKDTHDNADVNEENENYNTHIQDTDIPLPTLPSLKRKAMDEASDSPSKLTKAKAHTNALDSAQRPRQSKPAEEESPFWPKAESRNSQTKFKRQSLVGVSGDGGDGRIDADGDTTGGNSRLKQLFAIGDAPRSPRTEVLNKRFQHQNQDQHKNHDQDHDKENPFYDAFVDVHEHPHHNYGEDFHSDSTTDPRPVIVKHESDVGAVRGWSPGEDENENENESESDSDHHSENDSQRINNYMRRNKQREDDDNLNGFTIYTQDDAQITRNPQHSLNAAQKLKQTIENVHIVSLDALMEASSESAQFLDSSAAPLKRLSNIMAEHSRWIETFVRVVDQKKHNEAIFVVTMSIALSPSSIMSHRPSADNGPLLPQHNRDDDDGDKDVIFDEAAPLNGSPGGTHNRTRRQKWQSPRSKNIMVISGCLFIIPILCLLSPLLALDTLVPHPPQEAHAPKHHFSLTDAKSDAGSHTQDHRPWPTDDGFPSEPFRTDLGDVGGTQTGAEAFIVQTAAAYPLESALNPAIVKPTAKDARGPDDFDVLRHLGPLTPYTSSPNYLPTTPLAPDTCQVEEVHMLHRHGSRYPTPNSMPLRFSDKLSAAVKEAYDSDYNIGFHGELAFLNEWKYALGEAILTPVGRWQLYNSGAGFRLKYGHLLTKLTEHKPVFRTTTQDRMYKSAINWLAGFFGVESWQEESHLSIMHEASGYNNTLAPWEICPREDSYQSKAHVGKWRNKYLRNALKRLNKLAFGYEFEIGDVFAMQELCAYETVSLGYSEFCHLFTKQEWEGYDYSWDLQFYYDAGFGSPTARAQGLGWVEETLARITKQTPAPYDSTTNSTLNEDPVTFPLDMPMYTDFTHDTVIANVVAALNLTQFAAPLPSNRIPRPSRHSSRWRTSHISPFAGNLVVQVLSCDGGEGISDVSEKEDAWEITKTHKVPRAGRYIRLALNDAVHDLSGLGCPFDDEGLCPLDTFTDALNRVREEVDFEGDCHGKWDMGANDHVSSGRPPVQ